MHKEVRKALAKRDISDFRYLMVWVYLGIALGLMGYGCTSLQGAKERSAAAGYKLGYDTATNHAVDNIKKLQERGVLEFKDQQLEDEVELKSKWTDI